MAKAPLTPATDDSFVREVDEEYRKSQLQSFWARWGILLVAVVVIGLAALGGFLWWQAEQRKQAGATGEAFAQALTKLETGNLPEAAPILTRLASGDDKGYAALAKLTQAANLVTAGDTAGATKIFDSVAADTTQPQPLRDLATIKATRLAYDSLPPATVIARLKTLSLPGNPWFGVAGEMTAVAHIRAGQRDVAGALLASIAKDTTLPASLRGRAQQLAGSLGVDTGPLPRGAQ
ncbi:tetratricopeptide repeat protein [Glacieibacterium frigidum]|uniref:tetratricopeptide repeat protein n=1 Tax=Glacieibacterium frigidum TaxID=2593303 RepID=UPI00163D93CC|nr:tetratricopeptide repeat protein [Glacieibacterium frigidum]